MKPNKAYLAVLGLSAIAFGLAFSFYQPSATQAQSGTYCQPTGRTPVSQNAWCSTWKVKKWLTAVKIGGPKRWNTDGSVGPSDWEVKGTLSQEGIKQNFTETWQLTEVMSIAKKDANQNSTTHALLNRSNDEFKNPAGVLEGKADLSYSFSGYLGNDGARWNPTYYGQIFFGSDAQNSVINTYYPLEWTVQGVLE